MTGGNNLNYYPSNNQNNNLNNYHKNYPNNNPNSNQCDRATTIPSFTTLLIIHRWILQKIEFGSHLPTIFSNGNLPIFDFINNFMIKSSQGKRCIDLSTFTIERYNQLYGLYNQKQNDLQFDKGFIDDSIAPLAYDDINHFIDVIIITISES